MSKLFNEKIEEDFLEKLTVNYKDVSPYSQIKKDIILELASGFLKESSAKSALQLGCANGYETEILSSWFRDLLVVDGSISFIRHARATSRYMNVEFKHSLFEKISDKNHNRKYDYIFANYILEHVFEPDVILNNIHSLLKPDGILFVVVPNSQAFSRRLAQKMGYIDQLGDLTENDLKHGHRRVYSKDGLVADVIRSGFEVNAIFGVIFKVLADFQLNRLLTDKIFTKEHIYAMQKLAQDGNMEYSDSFFLALKMK